MGEAGDRRRRDGRGWRLGVLGTTAVAAWLRTPGLFANGFRPDEALFASFARVIAVWSDPLLKLQPVDKPPLLFYLQAAFYPLLGPVAWAARLPDWIASILLIPLAALLAWRLFGDGLTAVLAALLLAFSPLAIQFSPTAFTDPLLTTFLVASLAAMMGKRPSFSGFLFGLALATKYQAALFLPLAVSIGLWLEWRRQWRRWLAGVLPVLTAVFLWEIVRSGTFTLWQTQVNNFGGLRIIWSWELLPRLAEWIALWSRGAWAISGLAGLGLLIIYRLGRYEKLLALFLAGYFLLHWLLAIPAWDRYLLPVLPLAAILAGRTLRVTRDGFAAPRMWVWRLVLVGLIVGQLLLAVNARDGRYPFGSYPGADGGAAEVAEFLAEAPYGTVLYDHWFSWQWRYYLFGKKVFVNWFPDAETLVTDLTVFAGQGTRYLALPKGVVSQPVLRTLSAAGFKLQLLFQTRQTPGMNLYRIYR